MTGLTATQTKEGSPSPVVILGDDLTGCCDSAAPFASLGARTVVLPWQGDLDRTPGDVRSICTASRHDAADQAAAKVRRVVQGLPPLLQGRLVKKIDSTLKGNIASEVAALMELEHLRVAIVAPSFPEQCRLVGDGRLQAPGLIDGLHLPSVLRQHGGPAVRHFSQLELAEVNQSQQTARRLLPAEKEIWTFDAQCSLDLERVVDFAEHYGREALLVGSAGLTYALARRWRNPSWNREPELFGAQTETYGGRFVVVAGSQNASTGAQLDRLETMRGAVSLGNVILNGEALLDRSADSQEPPPVLLRWDWSVAMHAACEYILAILAHPPGTLVLTGGDTAQWFVDLAKPEGIELFGDVEPGVSWGRFRGGALDGWRLVTKAGGFGDPNSLLRLYDRCSSRHLNASPPHLTFC
jgi:uncharacterized protein YgbK (DUF1537 family)